MFDMLKDAQAQIFIANLQPLSPLCNWQVKLSRDQRMARAAGVKVAQNSRKMYTYMLQLLAIFMIHT